jgi:short-subunit dehydrogenase
VPEFRDRYGPWAVVTGAAQGVGLAFADALLDRGCSVVLVDRQPSVEDAARARGDAARAVVADLADPGWIDALTEAAEGLEVGLAVANAGVSFVGRFLAQPAESRRATVAVNCLATLELAAWALPPMVERGRGGFLVTSSGSALAGTGAVASYGATKAFGLNLAEAIGWELRGTGVDSAAVVAPAMDTPGWRSHPVAEHALVQPVSSPRDVVETALDGLPDGGCVYGDPGLALVDGMERRARVDLLSSATAALYPEEMGSP